ncbi:hypothetical protein K435DRAFT_856306 [Dendrothele bispora CBS 962.96]|uniref:Uncharacterized protein n=1 Tax=Dendrothele bispora (strain CBS 962.96) TaxID=1314807 RepID=A0A4S8M8R4_DENBC|nr:hypothetical protein K435DRAFT_856306 [Dendrothele bispora CBS 962.96]
MTVDDAPDVTMDASLPNSPTPSLTPQQPMTSLPVLGQTSTPRSRLPNFTCYSHPEPANMSGSTTSLQPSTSQAVNVTGASQPAHCSAQASPPPVPTVQVTPPAQNLPSVNFQFNPPPPNLVPPLNNQGNVAVPLAGGVPRQ